MRAAERIGDERGLLAGALRDDDLGRARRGAGPGGQVAMAGLDGGPVTAAGGAGRSGGGRDGGRATAAAMPSAPTGAGRPGGRTVRDSVMARTSAPRTRRSTGRVADRGRLAAVPGQRLQQRLLRRIVSWYSSTCATSSACRSR